MRKFDLSVFSDSFSGLMETNEKASNGKYLESKFLKSFNSYNSSMIDILAETSVPATASTDQSNKLELQNGKLPGDSPNIVTIAEAVQWTMLRYRKQHKCNKYLTS